MVIHTLARFGMPMSKIKYDLARTQIHGQNINFDIETKGQGQTEVMNVMTHRPKVIHSYAEYGMTLSKDKQEAHGPHRSPEVRVKIKNLKLIYHNLD